MVRTKFKRAAIDYSKVAHKSQTIPDQSMSIKELVRRFVKGIPAEVNRHQPVYHSDNNAVDLEKLGRQDPADKAFMASEMRTENEATAQHLQRQSEAQAEALERQEAERAEDRAQQGSIGSLDNTMLHDTTGDSQSLKGVKKSTSRKNL